jgi:hypothetical protein
MINARLSTGSELRRFRATGLDSLAAHKKIGDHLFLTRRGERNTTSASKMMTLLSERFTGHRRKLRTGFVKDNPSHVNAKFRTG